MIQDPMLGDIAAVFPTAMGPVMKLNPNICTRVGPAVCGFFIAHETGHVAMGHAYGTAPPQLAEAQADCWAAKNASPIEVRAAVAFFASGAGSTPTHGSGPARAMRIRQCAMGF